VTGSRPAVRLCIGFAMEVYNECRRAIYDIGENAWVVPEDFGIIDFLKVVGQVYDRTDDNPDELKRFDQYYNRPGETCLDLSDFEEMEAAPGVVIPSAVLLFVMALAGFLTVF
jgi:hypothetical protein